MSKQKRAGGQAARPEIPLALAPVPRDRVAMMAPPAPRPEPPRTIVRHRAGHVLARVIAPRVRALGNDGNGARIVWLQGDVGRFSQSEIDSVPGAFELLPEEPGAA